MNVCHIGSMKFAAFALMVAVSTVMAPAQTTFRVVATFPEYVPNGLTEGSPGVLYTAAASEQGGGSAFSVTTQGTITTLAIWPGGYNIESGLMVSAANGQFYSVVEYSDYPANVFSVTSAPDSGTFYPGQSIDPALTQNLPDGKLLGLGVDSSFLFHVIECDLHGTVTSIAQFPSTDRPTNVIYANDGNYYGVAEATGASTGYVFRLTPAGSFTTLYSFPANTFPGPFSAPLLQGNDANLYGAVETGGANGTGFIYQLTLGGQYTLLHTFPKDAGGPTTLIEASDGNLYGGTADVIHGELFSLTKSGQYTPLHTGRTNVCLTQGSDGIVYGVAYGEIFALDAGLPKPKPWAQDFTPAAGQPGTEVRLWGHNLLSAAVQFNGVPAETVSSSGPNYVWAIVPAGATTGPITITTPGGTITTQASFTVE